MKSFVRVEIGAPDSDYCITAPELAELAVIVQRAEGIATEADLTVALDGFPVRIRLGHDRTGAFGLLTAETVEEDA